jgi:hypothetical protein
MANLIPTTDDLGLAIRDALDLIECFDITGPDDEETGQPPTAVIDHVDGTDWSNLRIITSGAVFVVRMIREG